MLFARKLRKQGCTKPMAHDQKNSPCGCHTQYKERGRGKEGKEGRKEEEERKEKKKKKEKKEKKRKKKKKGELNS